VRSSLHGKMKHESVSLGHVRHVPMHSLLSAFGSFLRNWGK
jgi:hypothetical protein